MRVTVLRGGPSAEREISLVSGRAVAEGLRVNGVAFEIDGDDLIVHGKGRALGGGEVVTHMDHRIAMAFLAMGLASDKPVGVDDTSFIATSFPSFVPMMRRLGGDLG